MIENMNLTERQRSCIPDVHFDLMKRIPTAIGEAGFSGPAPATKVVIDK